MQTRVGMLDRVAGLLVGFAFIIIGMLLLVLGLTFLPVLGIIMALPVMRMSVSFLIPALSSDAAGDRVYRLPYMAKAT
jgi:hypothetical protein